MAGVVMEVPVSRVVDILEWLYSMLVDLRFFLIVRSLDLFGWAMSGGRLFLMETLPRRV